MFKKINESKHFIIDKSTKFFKTFIFSFRKRLKHRIIMKENKIVHWKRKKMRKYKNLLILLGYESL